MIEQDPRLQAAQAVTTWQDGTFVIIMHGYHYLLHELSFQSKPSSYLFCDPAGIFIRRSFTKGKAFLQGLEGKLCRARDIPVSELRLTQNDKIKSDFSKKGNFIFHSAPSCNINKCIWGFIILFVLSILKNVCVHNWLKNCKKWMHSFHRKLI